MRTIRHILRAVAVALIIAGVPAVLIRLGGAPRLPTGGQLRHLVIDPVGAGSSQAMMVGVLWCGWVAFTVAVAAEIRRRAHAIRHRQVLHLPQPMQALTAALLGAIGVTGGADAAAAAAHTATGAADGPAAGTGAPLSTANPAEAATGQQVVSDTAPVPTPARTLPADPRTAVAHGAADDRHGRCTVTVKPADTLWDIAEDRLGDPTRWRQIYHLNAARYAGMRGGHHIRPAWVLTLPDTARCHPPAAADPGPQVRPRPVTPAAPAPTVTSTPSSGGNPAPPAPGGPAQPTPSPTAAATVAPTPPVAVAPTSPAPVGSAAAPTARTRPPDDGVVAAPRPSPTGTATNTPSAGTPPTAGVVAAEPDRRANPPGVLLPGGGWVDLGLAAAIAAAVAVVWLHRRRRYLPRPPAATPRLDDPDLTPMPAVVRRVTTALRHPTVTDAGPADDDHNPGDTDDLLGDEQYVDGRNGGQRAVAVAPPVVPALTNATIGVWPPAGLGLTGPGADAAARGFLTAGLAAGGLNDPDARTWVVMPSATAATLLGAAAVSLPNTPRLTVTAGLAEALELLEAQTLHRTRLVYRHEVDDVTALRHADPLTEPLPPIMLIADATTRHEQTRTTAVLAQGQRLDIHGVLLGPWPDGNTVVVAADGTTTAAERDATRHGSHPADVGRVAVLDPTETTDLLRTLAESHTGQPQAPAPAEATLPTPPTTETAHPGSEGPHEPATADEPAKDAATATSDSTPVVNTTHQARTVEPEPGTPRDTPTPAPASSAPTPVAAADTAAEDDTPAPGRVGVTVLGGAGIVDADPQRKPRKKSLELLVYLAVHDGSAAAEAILDDLLPDASAKAAPHRLHTYVSDLRAVLRHNGGPGTYITNPNKHYALNRATVDIDLWRMRAALKDADSALTPQERTAALRRAVDTYTGPLAADCDYEWIEPYREAVRRQAFDAASALIEALDGHPDPQLAVLTAAIGYHPYAEELYQAAMRAQAQLGHPDAVRALRRTLTRRLADIDAEPSDDTITLADQLVAQLQRPGRAARLRPAPDPGDGVAA